MNDCKHEPGDDLGEHEIEIRNVPVPLHIYRCKHCGRFLQYDLNGAFHGTYEGTLFHRPGITQTPPEQH